MLALLTVVFIKMEPYLLSANYYQVLANYNLSNRLHGVLIHSKTVCFHLLSKMYCKLFLYVYGHEFVDLSLPALDFLACGLENPNNCSIASVFF